MSNESGRLDVHFTYKPDADLSTLCQGDILEITDGLKALLKDVHPYFNNPQYKYFIVLTQSCDLVRRNNKNCKSPYITLAAVRAFDDFFDREMEAGHYVEHVNDFLLMDATQKVRAYQLVERIYNNTEPDYFFLYKEENLNFPASMVAYLKVSIAFKSSEHYDLCLAAKRIELADEFKAKLGWLVGNIYSRVGTTDWESVMNSKQRETMISDELESRCIISGKAQLDELKKELAEKNIEDSENAREFIAGVHVQTNYDKVMDIIQDVLDKRKDKISDEEKEKIMSPIKSRNMLKKTDKVKPEKAYKK